MTKNQINKLYKGLSNHELAALAFNTTGVPDEAEQNTILGSVQWKTYQMANHAFISRLVNLVHFSHRWGIEVWKALYFRTASAYSTHSCEDEVVYWDTRLAVLKAALAAICKETGAGQETVLKYANVLHLPETYSEPDSKDVEKLIDFFQEII